MQASKVVSMRQAKARESVSAYLFLLPALIFFFVFVVVPIAQGVYTSFFQYTMKDFNWVGLSNYIELFQDPVFLKSLRNTILLVVVAVPFIVVFSIFASVTLYEKSGWVRSLFRGIFYLPVVTGTVSVTVVWKWIFDPLTGVLNFVLKDAGLISRNINWLGDKNYALWAIALVLFTTSVGQPIILFIAALGNLDKSQVEAAEIDGANRAQIFRYVEWPGILPTTLYVVVITTINSFQCFSLIQLLTSGGPNFNTSTIMFQVYETAFRLNRFGYANAMGVVLAFFIALFSTVQFRAFSSRIDY